MNTRIVLPIATAGLVLVAAPIGLAQPASPPVPTAMLGMTEVHGMTGEQFGAMVSELARSMPGAAAEHFRAMTPSADLPEQPGLPTAATERMPAGNPAMGGMGAMGDIGLSVGKL